MKILSNSSRNIHTLFAQLATKYPEFLNDLAILNKKINDSNYENAVDFSNIIMMCKMEKQKGYAPDFIRNKFMKLANGKD